MYAKGTKVPVEKTKMEIERVLSKYGAEAFASSWDKNGEGVLFCFDQKRIKIYVPTSPFEANATKQAERRRMWRCLLLVIKSKLEAVESDISTFDEEFLAWYVMPDGFTVGQKLLPALERVTTQGHLPPLLEAK